MFAFGVKKQFYAAVLMASLLLLQIALASISPFKLFENITNGGFDSYILTMDATNIQSLAVKPDNRARTRSRLTPIADLQILSGILTSFSLSDVDISDRARSVFGAWHRLIGRELSSRPQADMVALK